MRVSVVVPVFNEESTLAELLARLRAVLATIPGGPHEIVFVDDGSSDRTAEIIQRETERDPGVIGVVFSRNFGHQAAVTARPQHGRCDHCYGCRFARPAGSDSAFLREI